MFGTLWSNNNIFIFGNGFSCDSQAAPSHTDCRREFQGHALGTKDIFHSHGVDGVSRNDDALFVDALAGSNLWQLVLGNLKWTELVLAEK